MSNAAYLGIVGLLLMAVTASAADPANLSGTGPATIAVTRPATYKGYACTKDCSGHKAGYAWAVKKGITDIGACGGKSCSFVEGCRSRVREQHGEFPGPAVNSDGYAQSAAAAPE